jgi:hypothetical protein
MSNRERWNPMKPAVPVTKMVRMESSPNRTMVNVHLPTA